MSRADQLEKAADALVDAAQLALACHVGPDGDALGSMLALGLAARGAGKEVRASFGSPFAVPGSLDFLPGLDMLVPPAELWPEPEVMVVFDAGSAERLGELAPKASKSGTLIVLDHHVTNEGFGDVAVIDGEAAATGEIVFDLLGILGWEVTPEVATCLLTAIITDTGRFQYASTSPHTLQVAAALLDRGAVPSHISRHVYEEAPFGYLRVAAVALGRAVLDPDLGLVSTVVTQDDLNTAGIGWGDIDNLIDLLRLAEEADVALLIKDHGDGRVKASLRSRGETDVGSLALAMGGGGHRLAAGFTVEDEPTKVIEKVSRMIEEHR